MKLSMRLGILVLGLAAFGAQAETPAVPAAPAQKSEKIDVKAIQQEYLKHSSTELEVVEQRRYSNRHKISLDIFGGVVFTDPFLNVKVAGARIGYHITESLAVRALYWKDSVSDSSAASDLAKFNGAQANTNQPKDFKGGEVAFYPLYGKLSLLGSQILYLDLAVMAGVGVRGTESGNYVAPYAGLAGQLHLSQHFSLLLEFRTMYFSEEIIQKYPTSSAGTPLGKKDDVSGITTLGLSFQF